MIVKVGSGQSEGGAVQLALELRPSPVGATFPDPIAWQQREEQLQSHYYVTLKLVLMGKLAASARVKTSFRLTFRHSLLVLYQCSTLPFPFLSHHLTLKGVNGADASARAAVLVLVLVPDFHIHDDKTTIRPFQPDSNLIHRQFLVLSNTLITNCRNMSILGGKARQIFDSRGNPTVEVDLNTEGEPRDHDILA